MHKEAVPLKALFWLGIMAPALLLQSMNPKRRGELQPVMGYEAVKLQTWGGHELQ